MKYVSLILLIMLVGCEKDPLAPSSTVGTGTIPVILTGDVTNITGINATGSAFIVSPGASAISSSGICWSNSNSMPTVLNSKITTSVGTGLLSGSLTGLFSNTLYYVRAYAINSQGVGYGTVKTFGTNNIVLPSITTITATNIARMTATCAGNVSSAGNGTISSYGICWATTSSPTIANSKMETTGTVSGAFTMGLSSLTPNTTYYYRAYTVNQAGISYGAVLSFKTLI
jgi:hypothetical protein